MSRHASPIHWGEGMFLTPQHMQAMSRYIDSRLASVSLDSQPDSWGIGALDLDLLALENLELKVRRLDAILEDGTMEGFELFACTLEGAFSLKRGSEGVELNDAYDALPLGIY
ncbi:MAG: type VI secretion system baseplate subunit TssK, partial [Planctomycetota bacterium]